MQILWQSYLITSINTAKENCITLSVIVENKSTKKREISIDFSRFFNP